MQHSYYNFTEERHTGVSVPQIAWNLISNNGFDPDLVIFGTLKQTKKACYVINEASLVELMTGCFFVYLVPFIFKTYLTGHFQETTACSLLSFFPYFYQIPESSANECRDWH